MAESREFLRASMSTAACASSPFQGAAVVGLAVRRRREEEGIIILIRRRRRRRKTKTKDDRETSYRSQWTKQQRKDLFIVFSFYSRRAPSLCIDIAAAAANVVIFWSDIQNILCGYTSFPLSFHSICCYLLYVFSSSCWSHIWLIF